MDQSQIITKRIQDSFGLHDNSESRWQLLQELQILLKDGVITAVSYCNILNVLLDSLTSNIFAEKWQENLFDEIFLLTFHHDTFLILIQHLTKSELSYHQTHVLRLLEKFIQQKMFQMFMNQCCCNDSKLKSPSSPLLWNEIITCIISLPDRIANKTKGHLRKIFTPECYVAIIQKTIYKVLSETHCRLVQCINSNIEFLSKLIGRLCNTGYGTLFVNKLTLQFIKVCSADFAWRRVSQSLINRIPSSCMETFLVHFLTCIPWYGYVEWLLGEPNHLQPKIQYLMTVKFFFIRQFKDRTIQQNILGYLGSSKSRTEIFSKVFTSLLETWADSSALKHQNYAQQYYLCSSLIICCAYLKTWDADLKMNNWLVKSLDGSTLRLGSSDNSTRYLGMITGECLTSALDSNAPKLNFDEQFPEDILKLKDLLIPSPQPDLSEIQEQVELGDILFQEDKRQTSEQDHKDTLNVKKDTINNDSDDDLEPYDLPTDISEDVKVPLYIRDCLEGLIESNKPEWTEQCLRNAENLINSSSEDIKEIAQEMTKILLHLDDSFGMTDFVECRFKAMVALTIKCPLQVAEYLSGQFYERDYNIRQRLDILEVLAAASYKLSQPSCKEPKVKSKASSSVTETKIESWQEIVQKRIETKTRRFCKGPKKLLLEPEINIFGTVAGYFFFPLMENFDKESKMLDFFGEDSFVLGRLLYALGVIMHSASNTLISKHMGSKLLQFVLAIKDSEDAFVRQSAIFAIMSVLLSVSPYVLLSEFQEEIFIGRMWLEEIKMKDSNVDCQIQAAKAIEILTSVIQEELPSLFET